VLSCQIRGNFVSLLSILPSQRDFWQAFRGHSLIDSEV
jgi:hypothetical protein